jgi:uncharacterized lipoprotein YddW (UPF0748 family)
MPHMMSQRQRAVIAALLLLNLLVAGALVVVAQGGGGRLSLPFIARGEISQGYPVARINFQPATADIPPGYSPDSGALYGPRAGGLTYGWTADNTATARERNSPRAFDQRYDTFIHLQKETNPNAVWELSLPNGTYEVYLVAGDPDFFDGEFRLTVEGVLAVSGAPSEARPFVEGLVSVAVTDGRLTVTNGAGAINNKLAFLEVYNPAGVPVPTVTPVVTPTPQPGDTTEVRGLWVTRFDWTRFNQPADPAKIDEIVTNAAAAGFNVIYFQVRGAADAFYAPGLEPWAQRVSGGVLGQAPNPFWDPLAYFVEKAHARGIQVQAYLNVHPVWDNCAAPPPMTSPTPLYYQLAGANGTTDGKLNGLQWNTAGNVDCGVYLRYSPASAFANTHFVNVVADLVNRYDIDGIHLDNVRYGGGSLSCDPVSAAAYGAPCFTDTAGQTYQSWQRGQISALVGQLYNQVIVPSGRKVWLTAAVWPIYQDKWGWGVRDGYSYYYQDSQAWIKGGIIDSISPMIYPGNYDECAAESFWTQARWQTLVADFQANSGGRHIVPGIGTGYCTFDEIAWRIETARALGTAGHALFSYGGLLANDYFDDLAAGPYAEPATVPDIPWHP